MGGPERDFPKKEKKLTPPRSTRSAPKIASRASFQERACAHRSGPGQESPPNSWAAVKELKKVAIVRRNPPILVLLPKMVHNLSPLVSGPVLEHFFWFACRCSGLPRFSSGLLAMGCFCLAYRVGRVRAPFLDIESLGFLDST